MFLGGIFLFDGSTATANAEKTTVRPCSGFVNTKKKHYPSIRMLHFVKTPCYRLASNRRPPVTVDHHQHQR